METFFNNLVTFVFNIVGYVANLLLNPINTLINSYLNWNSIDFTVNDIASEINSFWSSLSSVSSWVLSFFGISQYVFDIVLLCWTFKLTVPYSLKAIKLAIAWFNQIKVG